jgi:hypothetical protein
MNRRHLLLGLIPIGAAIGALTAAVASQRPRVIGRNDPIRITIDDAPDDTPAGVLLISARARIPRQTINFRLHWFFQVRRWNDAGRLEELAPDQEYLNQRFDLAAGQTLAPTFHERWDMPAGRYNVLVGLREERPTWNRDATIAQRYSTVVAESRDLVVR